MPAVSEILNDLNRSQTEQQEKVAAAADSTPDVESAQAQLAQSLQRLNSGGNTKQASQADPNEASAIDGLQKMASDLAAADEQRLVKEAQLYGAAVFDGFIARANQYAQAAPGQSKVAAAEGFDADANVKLAAQLGYAEAENALSRIAAQSGQAKTAQHTKTAEELDHEGVIAAMEKIAGHADDCFRRGYHQIGQLADALANG